MELEVKNKDKGFSLIEILVALAVFSLLVISMSSIAITVIKSQRKTFALQNTQEAGRYLLESMSKELRMSTINSAAGNGLSLLNITNAKGDSFDYEFDSANKRLLRWHQTLSPTNIEVTGSFYVREHVFPPFPDRRKAVTIVMQLRSKGSKTEEQAEIYLQNTICPRVL